MQVKIKLLSDKAIIPSYAHSNDSGMDLFAIKDEILKAGETKVINIGLSIELPENTEAQIRPKSGLSSSSGVSAILGTIDEGYRGEIGVILYNHSAVDYEIKEGKKIAQMVIMPVLRPSIIQVKELSDTSRGEGGFGSTGLEKNVLISYNLLDSIQGSSIYVDYFYYGMRLRPFDFNCQPTDGFIKVTSDSKNRYHNILFYDRELTESQLKSFELDFLGQSRINKDSLHLCEIKYCSFCNDYIECDCPPF
jgi:dUTP pyrophosphatase